MRIRLHEDAIRELLTSQAGPVVREVSTYTRRTANGARRRAPGDTGQLRGSIQENITVSGLRVVGRVYSPLKHAIYQHEGTGIYGPTGQPIRPKKGKFLVFEPGRGTGPLRIGGKHAAPGKRGLVFAREVKGVPPNPFLTDALRAAVPWPIRENT